MIYDNISNHELYKGLTPDIYEGLKFLKNVDASIANGVYQINPRVKAIVSEYETKDKNEYGYEAHKKYNQKNDLPNTRRSGQSRKVT